MLLEMLYDHTRRRDPKLADRLMGVLLACIVHADSVLGGNVRRGEVPAEYVFQFAIGRLDSGPTLMGRVFRGRAIPQILLLYALRWLAGRLRWRYSSHRRTASSSRPWMA